MRDANLIGTVLRQKEFTLVDIYRLDRQDIHRPLPAGDNQGLGFRNISIVVYDPFSKKKTIVKLRVAFILRDNGIAPGTGN